MWYLWFLILGVIGWFTHLCKVRIDYLKNIPMVSMLIYSKVICLILLCVLISVYFIYICAKSGIDIVNLLFFNFECFVSIFENIQTLLKLMIFLLIQYLENVCEKYSLGLEQQQQQHQQQQEEEEKIHHESYTIFNIQSCMILDVLKSYSEALYVHIALVVTIIEELAKVAYYTYILRVCIFC